MSQKSFHQLAAATKIVNKLVGAEKMTGLLSAIEASTNTRFSVAIVGQMRSGKSTLLNALLGHDLALTAVNECTATVNRFTYSDDSEQHRQFLIHWRDEGRVEEYRHIADMPEWVGKSQHARKASFLDFFADAPFLKTSNVIDTPGLRSMLDAHESTIRSFLSQEALDAEGIRLAEATRRQAAAADAVVYVLGPNARENDTEILGLFGEKTRLPGSNPYNSIAIVHKWEPEWQDMAVDPETFMRDKVERIRKHLGSKVSHVMAASGLLSRCRDWLKEDHWRFFAKCGSFEQGEIEDLTIDFLERDAHVCFPFSKRMRLFNDLTQSLGKHMEADNARSTAWTIIRFLCRFACVRKIHDFRDLCRQVHEISGIAPMKEVLEKRFFARAQLIKLGTNISRLWGPAREALVRLQIQEQKRKRDMNRGKQALQLLETRNSHNSLQFAIDYVRDTFDALESDALHAAKERQQLAKMVCNLERQFRFFERDIHALESLDLNSHNLAFAEREKVELRALFGAKGMTMMERLAHEPRERFIQDRYEYWASKRRQTYGETEKICRFAEERLQEMLARLVNGVEGDEMDLTPIAM